MTTPEHHPLPTSTIAAIGAHARRRPYAPAIITEQRTVTYADLWRTIEGIASALLQRGLAPATTVGLVMANRLSHLAIKLALFRLGMPTLLLAAGEPPSVRRSLLARVGARACIANAAVSGTEDGIPLIAIDDLRADDIPGELPALPAPDEIAFFGRSSGTTGGVPKVVAVSFRDMAARDARLIRRFPYGPKDRYLSIAPLTGATGRKHTRIALASGAAIVFPPEPLSASKIHRIAIERETTATALTPPVVRDLLLTAPAHPLFPGMRLIVGTAALSIEERRAAMERLTPALYVDYATSEMGTLAIATPDDIRADPPTVGPPHHDIVAEAVDDQLQTAAEGTLGVLRFRTTHVDCYFDEGPEAGSRFRHGWFYPGDAGWIDGAGRIRIIGRTDDFMNIGGQKVHPGDIERVLAAHPAVQETVAIAWPSAREGEVPIAAIVACALVDEAALIQFCAADLSLRVRPRRIVQLDALPRNAAGKIDRLALVARLRPILDGSNHRTPADGSGTIAADRPET